jgi:hypothetical protein
MDNVKMFLFARWISTCYADSHLDNNMKSEADEGFKSDVAISVLNRESGYWYKKQLQHFNTVVYPNYIKNGTVKDTKQFLDDENIRSKTKYNMKSCVFRFSELFDGHIYADDLAEKVHGVPYIEIKAKSESDAIHKFKNKHHIFKSWKIEKIN